MYTQTQRSHTLVQYPVAHVRVWWITETPQIQDSLNLKCQNLQSVEVGHYTTAKKEVCTCISRWHTWGGVTSLRVVRSMMMLDCMLFMSAVRTESSPRSATAVKEKNNE